ncbi:MAG TPA: UbiA family prenyltransferase [Gemmatimonadaceae bacterium]|nr:UbiA family prenyltransferase [Gemmatimonadaceae bacterium]
MSSVRAYLELARWPNAVMAGLGVIVGARVEQGAVPYAFPPPLLAAIGAALALTATANAWNDAADVAIDRVAHPERPLPRGALGAGSARRFALVAAAAGIAFAFAANRSLGPLSIIVVAAMLAYSRWFKTRPVLGNAIVAVLASLPFLYGGLAVGEGSRAAALALLAFLLHFAREVAKDLVDMPADAGARRTIPVAFGAGGAKLAALAMLALFLWTAAATFAANAWAVAAFLLVAALLLAAALEIRRDSAAAPRTLKMAMFLAMLCVLALNDSGHLVFRTFPAAA